MNSCYLCNSNLFKKRDGVVWDKPELEILECNDCGLVFLSDQNHINTQHYENSGMHGEELPSIIEWLNDTDVDDSRRFQFVKNKIINKKILDFGCGAGGFLSKAKILAIQADGVEIEQRLQNHFQKQNLNVYSNVNDIKLSNNKYHIITAFHVVEHLSDPIKVIRELSNILEKDGELIIEVPNSDDALLSLFKSKEFSRFTYWSQHLYLFNNFTLSKLIYKSGLNLNWIQQIQRFPVSNHLHWLSKGKPGGHKKWSFLDSQEMHTAYESKLASLGICDTLVASVSKH